FQDGPDGHERWSWRRAPPLPRFPVRRGGNPFPVLLVLCSLKWPVAEATTCSNSISPFPNDRRLVHIFFFSIHDVWLQYKHPFEISHQKFRQGGRGHPKAKRERISLRALLCLYTYAYCSSV